MKKSKRVLSMLLTLAMAVSIIVIPTMSVSADEEYVLGGQYKVTNVGFVNDCSKVFNVSRFTGDVVYKSDATNEWVTVCRNTQATNNSTNKTYVITFTNGDVKEAFKVKKTGYMCFSMDVNFEFVRAASYQPVGSFTLDNSAGFSLGNILCDSLEGSLNPYPSSALTNDFGRVELKSGGSYSDWKDATCSIKPKKWYRYSWLFYVVDEVPQTVQLFVEQLDTDGDVYSSAHLFVGDIAASEIFNVQDLIGSSKTLDKLNRVHINVQNGYGASFTNDSGKKDNAGEQLFAVDNMKISFVEPAQSVMYGNFNLKNHDEYIGFDSKADISSNNSNSAFKGSAIQGGVKGLADEKVSVYAAIIDTSSKELVTIYSDEITLDENGYGVYNISITDKTVLNQITDNVNYEIKVFNWNKNTLAPYNQPGSVLNS